MNRAIVLSVSLVAVSAFGRGESWVPKPPKPPSVATLTNEARYVEWKWRTDVTDPATGIGNKAVTKEAEALVGEHESKEPWRVVKAKAFALICDRMSIGVSDLDWFRENATNSLRHAERKMANGAVVYVPQGTCKYEAFWLRDYEMMLEAGIVPPERIVPCAKIFLNAVSPRGEGVDCVKFDGTPVYKPGYGSMGENAVLDGCAYTVLVAAHSWRQTKDAWFLAPERLALYAKVLSAIPHDAAGLSWIDPAKDWDRCPWGFTDTVRKTGACLFSSLLEVSARREFAAMLAAAGSAGRAAEERAAAGRIAAAINRTFWDESAGLYRAATVRCREHDVFGSAYAVWLGVAEGERARRIATVFRDRYADFVLDGQVRHLSKGDYWELCSAGVGRDFYQNGGYWGTASGWFAWTLSLVDRDLALRTLSDLRRSCERNGSPEWISARQVECPEYLSTLALPYQALRRLSD